MDIVLDPGREGSLDGPGEGALVVGDVVVVQDEVVQTGGIVDLCQPPADPQHDWLWSLLLLLLLLVILPASVLPPFVPTFVLSDLQLLNLRLGDKPGSVVHLVRHLARHCFEVLSLALVILTGDNLDGVLRAGVDINVEEPLEPLNPGRDDFLRVYLTFIEVFNLEYGF